ncbi:hypothetical protein GN244_ATG00298 [Phytophthora infestans]|uniref:Uncharacterized protein n=1 Tax=Phytophthora infestans TaxID=4787 RepID=A0A833WQQ0_PHYIN|nr:hypothetical protein GN244_ATG00298 [Phytophthora infestans]KAF4139558.1 hypothetical protein GN958_ATG11459 [Phytophthora infestans]
MESPDSAMAYIGGPYPEEILLEAYNLEWESIELRRQRLQKTWQQLLLAEAMEEEELRYRRQLRRIKRQELEKQAHEQEAQRCEREKEAALSREKEREEIERKRKQVIESGTQTAEEEPAPSRKKETKTVKSKEMKAKTGKLKEVKTKTAKPKEMKSKVQPTQNQKTKSVVPKRITPVSLPSTQPKGDDSVSEENQNELGGYDSPPPELPDDGLLGILSNHKDSDSDEADDQPSMVSLILPVAQESPKRVQKSPVKKKTPTPQKRFAKRKGGPPLDFNFSNAEARRQAKIAEAAGEAEQEESDEADAEPEPMPTPIPKKRLRRRKDLKAAPSAVNTAMAVESGKEAAKPLAHKAKTTTSAGNNTRKKTVGNNASKDSQTETKPQMKTVNASGEEASLTKKKVNGKSETMSIKQRLANAELLARMNKMQDVSTPKVLGKKTKKGQKEEAAKTLAVKRAEFRKVLASDTAELDVPRRDQMIDEDLNISLNSSGLISDNDSPENLRAITRKRPRGAVEGDVTPTKKLQFLEITKRLAKSPMPRYLRTPTPLMSPVVASGLTKPRAASPGPRSSTLRNTTAASTRRLNSAPIRSKNPTNANRFGGGVNAAVTSGSFSMFDAFVNSGSNGSIPRLKTKTRSGSPSV